MTDTHPLTTEEGEYGAWGRLDGIREGARCTRFVACVYGDEFTLALDARVTLMPELAAVQQLAMELVLACSLKLGLRRRRFVYRAPPTWTALASGLVANWYPPDFPANRVNIVVPAAEPSHASAAELADPAPLIADYSARGFELDGEVELDAIVSNSGVSGRRCALSIKSTARGERTRIEIGAYAAPPYVYVMRMESLVPTRGSEHHAIFLDALRTVTTLPLPGTSRTDRSSVNGEALSHWAE